MHSYSQSRIVQLLLLAAPVLFSLAWLNPNHYAPWTAFHADWIATCALTIIITCYLFSKQELKIPASSVFIAIISLIPLIQFKLDIIYFFGDAWMSFLYLFGFSAAIFSGRQNEYSKYIYSSLIYSIFFASIISFFLALNQWLLSPISSIFIVDTPRHGRPSANLAQPNQLATLLILGVISCIQLYENKNISKYIFRISAFIFCFGAALTQSRAAWLELTIFAFIFTLSIHTKKNPSRLTIGDILSISIFYIASVIYLPIINDFLALTNRDLAQQLSSGTRPIHWATIWDAALTRPWSGFGWNQVSVAISQTAHHHPPSHEFIEHSHNLALDIIIWNGFFLGSLILIACGYFIIKSLINIKSMEETILLSLISIPLGHSLVEFPLEYAYFLFPVGIFIGRLELLQNSKTLLRASKFSIFPILITSIFVISSTTSEYLSIEQETRNLRLESQKIGPPINVGENLNIKLLTQQSNFIKFAATESHENMSIDNLQWMKKISERYGYPPALFRYAIASGINYHPEEATKSLQRLCKIHPIILCIEARDNWEKMGLKNEKIKNIDFPIE